MTISPEVIYTVHEQLPGYLWTVLAVAVALSVGMVCVMFVVGVIRCFMPSQRTMAYVFGAVAIIGVGCAVAGAAIVLYFQKQIGVYYEAYWS